VAESRLACRGGVLAGEKGQAEWLARRDWLTCDARAGGLEVLQHVREQGSEWAMQCKAAVVAASRF